MLELEIAGSQDDDDRRECPRGGEARLLHGRMQGEFAVRRQFKQRLVAFSIRGRRFAKL